jgi:hypothetical protein
VLVCSAVGGAFFDAGQGGSHGRKEVEAFQSLIQKDLDRESTKKAAQMAHDFENTKKKCAQEIQVLFVLLKSFLRVSFPTFESS